MAGDPGRDGLERTTAGPEAGPLEALLDRHFDGRPGLLREFPILLDPPARGRCHVWRKGRELVAHAAWRPLELVLRSERLPAAGIGLVTTHGAFRERGLASDLVQACTEAARREGAALALLFGAVRGLYTRLGFEPAGRERVTRLWPPGVPPQPSGSRSGAKPDVRKGGAADAADLLELLRAHPLRVERSLGDFERLLGIPDTHVHVLERGGRVQAYCVEGKGRDLRGVVHEWAGEAGAVASLLGAVAQAAPTPLHVLSPAALPPPIGGEHAAGHLALIRILDAGRLGTASPVEAFGCGATPGARDLYVWGLDSV